MKRDEIDPTLMMNPALNELIALSTAYHEGLTRRRKEIRAILSGTPFYHDTIVQMFGETSTLTLRGSKAAYPIRRFLGNLEIQYLPKKHVWKVLITNGGMKRKNASVPYKIKRIIYVRRLSGIYFIDKGEGM